MTRSYIIHYLSETFDNTLVYRMATGTIKPTDVKGDKPTLSSFFQRDCAIIDNSEYLPFGAQRDSKHGDTTTRRVSKDHAKSETSTKDIQPSLHHYMEDGDKSEAENCSLDETEVKLFFNTNSKNRESDILNCSISSVSDHAKTDYEDIDTVMPQNYERLSRENLDVHNYVDLRTGVHSTHLNQCRRLKIRHIGHLVLPLAMLVIGLGLGWYVGNKATPDKGICIYILDSL